MNEYLMRKVNEMNSESLLALIEDAKDYAIYKGIGMRCSNFCNDARVHLPFCLLPAEFPEEQFHYVYDLQTTINLILHKVAYSKETIEECFKNTIESDEFTRNLFSIYEKVFDNQAEISLGIIRSDYLLTSHEIGIKQVENNTVSVGFGGISPLLRDLYNHIFEKLEWKNMGSNLPENKSCEKIAKAMISAWYAYGKEGAVIMFVVEESTFNIYDQRLLEYKIKELDDQIKILRCTFNYLRSNLALNDKKLYVNDKEVAMVYFRVGYAPDHYEPEDWSTRLLIEQSRAIKCPSIGLHLAGTKRVQMYLAQEGVLEKFLDPSIASKLRRVFASQYSLDTDSTNAIIFKAMRDYNAFVLKPEREGGGNNLYDLDIKTFLENAEPEKIKSYILMEKIKAPSTYNFVVRSKINSTNVSRIPDICSMHDELGIFGIILGDKNNICQNETVGHLLRSKPININEGGVACGSGCLCYPYLV